MASIITRALRVYSPVLPTRPALRLFAADARNTGTDVTGKTVGLGHTAEDELQSEEDRKIAAQNEAEAKKIQEGWMRDNIHVNERTNYRDPDPNSSVNTAGTVTNTVEEFASEDKPRRIVDEGQDPRDRSAKQQMAEEQHYEGAQASPPGKPGYQIFPPEETRPQANEKSEPLLQSTLHKATRSLKQAVNTMAHGINNAGQPEIEQELQEAEGREGTKK